MIFILPATKKNKAIQFLNSSDFEILLLQHKHKHKARNNDDRFWKVIAMKTRSATTPPDVHDKRLLELEKCQSALI